MHTSRPLATLILLISLFGSLCAQADVVVVVSAQSPVAALSHDQVADIFLGRVASFPGGAPSLPIDQTEGTATRDEFYLKATGKVASQMKAYWTRMIFTGRGQPPVVSGNDEAIKRQVAHNPQLIGYIDKAAVDSSVKVVATLR